MHDVLIHGDTVRSPDLRHELPLSIGDAFLYAEAGGVRHIVISSLEVYRVRELPGPFAIHPWEKFGILDGSPGRIPQSNPASVGSAARSKHSPPA